MRVILTGLLLTLFYGVTAQGLEKGNGKITGKVYDQTSKEPVEFATIALKNPDGEILDGTVCDTKGKFSLTKIPNGHYTIRISFIGFETKDIAVTITENESSIDLADILLTSKTELLDEVTVEAEKVLIEERIDRTIYNAENDETTRGGDATDVLKRVPLLTVDMDGNLSLRGSRNIRVLINNKPSAITASSVSDALKMIPAEDIKTVEVITSPSAKYDAEGSSGIVNIITKKNVLEGAMLRVGTSAGLRGSNLNLNGAYRKGKLGLNLGGWGRMGYNVQGEYENRQQTTDILNVQKANTQTEYLLGHYNFGLDYDINKNNFITASARIGARNFNTFQDNFITQSYDASNTPVYSSLGDVDLTNDSENLDINLGYTRLYEKPQKEFSLLGLYTRNNRTNDFVNNFLDENTHDLISSRKNLNDSYNVEGTIQLDYQAPIGEKNLIELGGKQIIRTVSSDYRSFFLNDPDGLFELDESPQGSNVFTYNQNVSAAYSSLTLGLSPTITVKAGGRYEYTTIDADFEKESAEEIPNYGILVPSFNIGKKFKQGNMLKFGYNRRVSRPSIEFLNPNIQPANNLNISQGNPNLDPEFTNNFELTYSYFIKGSMISLSGFTRNTNNAIQSLKTAIGDTIKTTYANIGQEDAYGFNLFVGINVGSKINLNGGTDIYYSVLQNNDPNPDFNTKNQGWTAGYRLFGSYALTENLKLQAFGFYRARQVQLQGTQGGFGFYTLSIQKDFAQKRGSIGLGAENFFTPRFKQKSEFHSASIDQYNTNISQILSFKIDFSYRIGKLGKDENAYRRRKKTIQNDDLKGDGGNDMQGGGMSAPPSGGARPNTPPPTTRQGKKNAKKQLKEDPSKESDDSTPPTNPKD